MGKVRPVVGLDIGSSKVCCVVALPQDDHNAPDIVGVGIANNSGVRRGEVIDPEETVSAISEAIAEAERMSGIHIESAVVGISGSYIEAQNSKGIIAVSKTDNVITEEDVARVIEAAKAIAVTANKEVLHVLPRSFMVDGQTVVKDPIGMTGVRLETDVHLITSASPQIRNLTKCIYQAGLNVESFVLDILADARFVLNSKQKDLGVALVNIGSASTSMAVFEEGVLVHSAILPIGAAHITNDLAIGLRTNLDVAEQAKIRFAYASLDGTGITEREMVDLSNIDPLETHAASQKYVIEIVEARMSELFALIKTELVKIDREGTLPAGVVLTGGGSGLRGLVDFAKDYLGLPVAVGVPNVAVQGLIDKVDDPAYTTAIGLAFWGMTDGASGGATTSLLKPFSNIGGEAMGKVKDFFKQFLP